MAERHEDFDRGRDRERNWERDRERERGREFGQFQDDFRRENQGGSNREFEQYGRERDYGRESGNLGNREGLGSESRYGSRYGTGANEQYGNREDWRSRGFGGQTGQGAGGGMGSYSSQDWRSRQGSFGGGLGEGFGRGRESFETGRGGYPESGSNQGSFGQGSYGQGSYGQGSYGQGSFGQGSFGDESRRGYFGESNLSGRFTGRGPKGYQRSDERIREEVCDRLTQHPDVDASNIDVTVNNGEVTLSGTVDDRQQRRLAEDAIENLSGVREVHVQLRVSKGIGQQIGEALGISGQSEQTRSGGTTTTAGTSSSAGRQNEPVTTRR